MKKLKMKSLKSLIVWIILLIGFGIFFFPRGFSEMVNGIQKSVDLEDIDYSGELDNLKVSGTVVCIYDYYCETTKDGILDSREYIIDGGDDYYIGMLVKKKDMPKAEALMEASYAYLMGEDTDINKVYDKQYEVTGVIRKMPSDSWDLYKEYMEWDTMSEEEQAMHLPYYLVVNDNIGAGSANTWVFLIIGSVCLGFGIYFIIRVATGGCQKSVKRYIESSSNPEAAREKVEAFFANTPAFNGIIFNREFISAQSGSTTVFNEISKLLWIYQSKTTHKRNFITVGVTYELVLGFVDGKKYTVGMKNEAKTQEAIKALIDVAPQVVAGYDKDLDRMFDKDMSAFRQLRYDAVMAEQQNLI